jgi:hypothetical protein
MAQTAPGPQTQALYFFIHEGHHSTAALLSSACSRHQRKVDNREELRGLRVGDLCGIVVLRALVTIAATGTMEALHCVLRVWGFSDSPREASRGQRSSGTPLRNGRPNTVLEGALYVKPASEGTHRVFPSRRGRQQPPLGAVCRLFYILVKRSEPRAVYIHYIYLRTLTKWALPSRPLEMFG